MAVIEDPFRKQLFRWEWLRHFLQSELEPYPGRAATVGRITLAVSITLILAVTFRIPGAALALYNVLTLTRATPQAAVRGAINAIVTIVAAFCIVFTGIAFTVDYPLLRFVLLAAEYFCLFFFIRTAKQPSLGTAAGLAIYAASIIWEKPFPPNERVEATLWQCLTLCLGTVVAAAVELLFSQNHAPFRNIRLDLHRRLTTVALYWESIGRGQPATEQKAELVRFATVGTAGLRRRIAWARGVHVKGAEQASELNALVAITARLVDLSASLTPAANLDESDRLRFGRIARELRAMQSNTLAGTPPEPLSPPAGNGPTRVPVLPELESTLALIPQIYSADFLDQHAALTLADDPVPSTLLVADAFSNPEYVAFALRGCLAAMVCYVIYMGLNWPEIGTAVVTCFTTTATAMGVAAQKQVLRLSGAAFGGLILGIGSLIFLVPEMDSVTAITLLVAAVTALGAWIATSSPRLSYFGMQACLAFYLTVVHEDRASTTLTPARDRVVGVFLGLSVMWIISLIWRTSAVTEMQRQFARNARMLAQLCMALDRAKPIEALPEVRHLRELLQEGFSAVHASADAVLFEMKEGREERLRIRDRIVRWQAQLRTFALTQISIIHYRLQIHPEQLPPELWAARRTMNRAFAKRLEWIAEAMEGHPGAPATADMEAGYRGLESEVIREGNLDAKAEGILALTRELIVILSAVTADVEEAMHAAVPAAILPAGFNPDPSGAG